jgi:hypothetical protein
MIINTYSMADLRSRISGLILLFFFLSFCSKGPQKATEIYNNNFEGNNLSGISGGLITRYNNSNVLGRYNSGGFTLDLEDLSAHDLIQISFDLFIHDSWDGNKNSDGVSGPDIWEMKIDGSPFIYTTFSNFQCPLRTCSAQSYPLNYPNYEMPPTTGSFRTDLPGVCSSGTTVQYKISKTLRHSGRHITIEYLDELKQTGSLDPLCDESWSVDNIVIKVIKLD